MEPEFYGFNWKVGFDGEQFEYYISVPVSSNGKVKYYAYLSGTCDIDSYNNGKPIKPDTVSYSDSPESNVAQYLNDYSVEVIINDAVSMFAYFLENTDIDVSLDDFGLIFHSDVDEEI